MGSCKQLQPHKRGCSFPACFPPTGAGLIPTEADFPRPGPLFLPCRDRSSSPPAVFLPPPPQLVGPGAAAAAQVALVSSSIPRPFTAEQRSLEIPRQPHSRGAFCSLARHGPTGRVSTARCTWTRQLGPAPRGPTALTTPCPCAPRHRQMRRMRQIRSA